MKKYKAIKKGYDGKQIREEGEVFEFAGKPGSWMEPVEKESPKKEEKPAKDKK